MKVDEVSSADSHAPITMPVGRSAIQPPETLLELQHAGALHRLRYPDGHVGWLVTDYGLGREVLGDPRFSMHPQRFPVGDPERLAESFDQMRVELGFPQPVHHVFERVKDRNGDLQEAMVDPEVVDVLRHSPPPGTGGLIGLDAPHHTRMRRALAKHFAPRRVELYRQTVEESIDFHLNQMADSEGPIDLVASFAMPVTLSVICTILGASPDDIPRFAPAIEARQDPESKSESIVETARSFRRFDRDLVQKLRKSPGDDVLSDLIRDGELSDDELVNVAVQLFSAGFDTTANMLSLAVFTILQDRSRWELLCRDETLIPGALEEILRYVTLIQVGTFSRTALEDVSVGGAIVRSGESVTVSLTAANRDDAQFPDPHELDLSRSAVGHMSFGFGVHMCLGQHLARLELTSAIRALTRRMPDLRLAVSEDEIEFHGGERQTYGMVSLPVEWS